MEVVEDKVIEFFVHKFTSAAGKPCSVHKMTLAKFGPVSLGFTKPETLPFVEGDSIVINVENKFGEWQYQGEATAGATVTAATPPAKKAWSGGGGFKAAPKVFPIPPKHGDMAIIHQNSLTNAREMVCSEEYSEALAMAKSNPLTPKEMEDEVIRLAYRFADFSSGADLVKE